MKTLLLALALVALAVSWIPREPMPVEAVILSVCGEVRGSFVTMSDGSVVPMAEFIAKASPAQLAKPIEPDSIHLWNHNPRSLCGITNL